MSACEPDNQAKGLERPSALPLDQLQRLYANFRGPYIGEIANDFVAALAHYEGTYDPEIYCGHTIVIVPSSGTGKSRLVEVDFFTRSRIMGDESPESEELAAAFLRALMKSLLDGVRQKTTTTGPKDLLSDWENADPADPQTFERHQLFAQVETSAEETLHEHHEELRLLRLRPTYDPELPDHRLNPLVWHKSLLRVLVRPHMETLAELLQLRGYSRFIVAFDDRTTLNARFGINMSWMALQRIINAADRLALPVKFWFLLLDKTPSLYDLAPREKITSSFLLKDKFKDAASVDVPRVQPAPQRCLFDDTTTSTSSPSHEDVWQIHIGEGEGSIGLATASVRSHMRVPTGVADNLLVTEAPSEPILSIAAATALLEGFRDLVRRTYSHRACGRSKPSGRSMLPVTDDPQPRHGDAEGSRQTLLGPELSFPMGNTLRDRLLDDTAGIWINFTHVVQLDEIITELTPEFLKKCWSSNAAIQCSSGQSVFNEFFVGYRDDLSKPFDNKNLIYVLWRTNTKTRAGSHPLVDGLAGTWIVPKDGPRYKPTNYLAIVMDLCATTSFQDSQKCRLTYEEPWRPRRDVRGLSTTYPVIGNYDARFRQLLERTVGYSDARFAEYAEKMYASVRHLTLVD
ncbi:hypothetical protein HETIRDRAFT_427441 [Heterobasidion irregulare TC 32-1]|uniref:Uncharacterized protein n=1 Tax=Heterobasidion irregulare (strain TC 32-1) TaxID=747525 RepID=W4K5L3_HETIT|nr:uncharacterized protein HETIRDRAFT_427441 [Heterobasidion irregulare TC 32-1]ETW80311.1 hypothetical protein HETIRDRAFT_427441 [Heterobasidion irregulare TC 32-1]